MEINEINDISTDNLATESLDVVNFNPSDELDVGENNYDYGETLYAKKKRTSKLIKVVATTLAVGASGVLGGSYIASVLTVETPSIEIINIAHEASDVLKMSYDITNTTEDKIYFVVLKDNNEVYQHDSSSTDHYEYIVELDAGSYVGNFIKQDADNNISTFDDYTFEFTIVK